jgi:ABC-2 type transport system permease protein
VLGVECAKLTAQPKVAGVLAACAIGPFAFVGILRLQSSLPEDTLFGRALNETGFATPLVVLGFASLWILPVLASIIGGDILSAEDRYRTWTTVLTRSRSRAEIYAGKLLAAVAFTSAAVGTLGLSSILAGVLVVGHQPLIDLSGTLVPPAQAMARVALAWLTIVPPTLGFTALALMISATTRSGAAGIGFPVLASLAMQLVGYVDGRQELRAAVLTNAFDGWHGLFVEHPFYGPLAQGFVVSTGYVIVCIAITYRVMQRRDFT